MSELIVFTFKDLSGAGRIRNTIARLQKEQKMILSDAATVVRKPDGRVNIRQAISLVGIGALGGAFWGMLIGLLFYMPWMGLTPSDIPGTAPVNLPAVGIDATFVKDVGETIEPGHSALFLMVDQWAEQDVLEKIESSGASVLKTSLSKEQETRMIEAFGAGD